MRSIATRIGVVSVLVLGVGASETASQTVELKQVMHRKLAEFEKLLGALVTSDWAELARRGRTLEELTSAPAWQALKTPEYVRQSATFVQATRDLVDAADRHDEEAAPVAYLAVTLSCVRCHQYVARMRMADATNPTQGR